ncbi:MAG: sigma-70 family RNA polymerase sigma factor [Bacteroidota bacterium]
MTEKQLIKACLRKDGKAEKQLFLRFAPKVLTLCRRYAANNQDAEDYLQECFLHLFDRLRQYDDTRGAFGGWLYRLCTNRILQLIRAQNSKVTMIFPEQLPEQGISNQELAGIPQEQILHAIQQLPEAYRLVLNLYVFDGWQHEDIAAELGISPSSSRSRLTRARALLKKILKKSDDLTYEKRLAR